jgi:hypothetical protein
VVDLAAPIDHTLLRVAAEWAAALGVRGHRGIQQSLVDRTGRDAVYCFGEAPRHLVADRDLGREAVLGSSVRDQLAAQHRQEAAAQVQADVVVLGLHDQQDGRAAGPARQDVGAQEVAGAPDQVSQRVAQASVRSFS